MKKEKFFMTTAIAYTSGKPHIGNTYEIVLSDAIARYKRFKGYDVYFQTGTDEHGQKIEQKANEKGVTPQEFVDDIASEIKRIWDLMDTSYDRFVRTTEPEHIEIVQKVFKKLYEQGDIYKGEYQGLYCTPCESFFTEKELEDGKCPDCHREVQLVKEEAYFLRLTKYEDRLKQYIEEHPDFIQPVARKNEMVNNFLNPGLQDLCVSRTSFKWGVPVDFDNNHIVYVWIDALSNYFTTLGYDPTKEEQPELFKKYWRPDLQIIGKDILRFHTIYWPIILMALDLPLPEKIFGHPWLLINNGKMSKSVGNVIYADELVEKYGVDAVRYYLLHEIPFSSDGNITYDLLEERINGELANVLGNLVQRTISMTDKYFDRKIINKKSSTEFDSDLIEKINKLEEKIDDKMNNLEISLAIDEIFNVLRSSNKYIDETTPWILAKDPEKQDTLETVLYNLLESIRVCAVFLKPFLPSTSDRIFEQLNTDKKESSFLENNNYELNLPEPLFKRITK